MDTAQPISVFLPPLLYGIGHGTPCPYKNKKHRAGTKIIPYHCPEKADPTERSWRGVLRGHVPSKSLSADSEIPCAHTSGHTEKVGEKSDSFSRAERTRPLRPVSRLNGRNLENIPVECFQRDFPLLQNHRTRHAVSLQSQSARNTSPAALSWSSLIGQLDEMRSVSAQQKSSATSRISSARGGASLFSLSCPAQAQRSGLTSFSVRSSVWLRLQLQTLPVRWEPEQLQTHPWFSVCC